MAWTVGFLPWRALAAAALGAWVGVASAQQPSPTDYARRPDVQSVQVSPDNSHAALLARGPKGRLALVVIDLADPGKRKVVAAYDDVDVLSFQWVNDKRLVYYAQQPGPLVDYEKWGTFAIDRDGGDERLLISARSGTDAATGSSIRQRVLPRGWDAWKPVGDGSDDLLVTRWFERDERGWQPQVVARVNTRDLSLRMLSDGQPAGADGWVFDGKGQLRVVSAVNKDRRQLWWKPNDAAAWELLQEDRVLTGANIVPVALESDGTLIVRARPGRDTEALYTYDLRRRQIDPEPLVGVAGFDVQQVVFDHRQGRVVGVPVEAQRPSWVWFDEGLAAAQAAVDKALPAGRSNQLLCGNCAGAKRFVVASWGDRHPGEYYLYDAAAGKLTLLTARRPWFNEASQGQRSFHRVAARDGLSLPVVVTHPVPGRVTGPAPTVMLVHGGPWAPGADTLWSDEPQFLAALGYRVLEVSFRGTTGLGWKHYQSSWGQYGLSMQDDLEDALLWAVREKLTDPQRVCIYGASYGGYAALMGPVQHPGRYRCAVSHVGVTDLGLLYSGNWTDINEHARKHSLSVLIGDRERDAERLRRMSPVNRVAEIKVPVLLVQGRLDRRVSPEHADRFTSAARQAGVNVERVDYEEGHGFSRAESHADFLARLATFLSRNLQQP